MSLPPELWRRIATGLSSTWASTDWEVVTAEVLRRAEVCKKRQARATQMTQEPSADIRDRVIDALGGIAVEPGYRVAGERGIKSHEVQSRCLRSSPEL